MMLLLASLASSVNTIADIDMSYWNQGYNRKKQMRDSVERQRQKSLTTSKPLYRDSFGTQRHEWQIQKQKEKRFWILGGVIIGFVAIMGIVGIIWVMNI